MSDASAELSELDQKLSDATTRFDRTPGALWLAATAVIESATRLGDALPAPLAERQSDLLVRARRARDEAGPRSSENDVSAITLWVELAEKRAVLERAVQAALGELAAHRAQHRWLGETPASRAALERALGEREKDVVERERRRTEPADAPGSAEPDDETVTDAALLDRVGAAQARLARGSGAGRGAALVVVAIALSIAAPFSGSAIAGLGLGVVAALALVAALVVLGRARRARSRDRVDALALRRRDDVRAAPARLDQEKLVAAAKALGALDAFGGTSDGRALEERESKLVTLAPWIRDLVSGFTPAEASRFA